MATHGIVFAPRNALIVSAGRYVAQKLLDEYEKRKVAKEAERAHKDALFNDAPTTLRNRLAENVRLADEQLAVACAAVDGCIIDFTETIRETMRGEAGPEAMVDAIGAAIVEENTERREA